MSGESEDDDAGDWVWAHILWQKHGIRMEEFAEMPFNVRLAYIASEELEIEHPRNAMNRLAKVYIKSK